MRKLHPATIVVALLPRFREALQASVPLLIGSFASGHGGGNHDWIAIFIGGFTGIFAIGTYLTTRFEVMPDHISHKTGWIFRKDRRIPIQQVQNVNIRQNLIERLLKVATVDVETAMGRGRDMKLSVLGLADAEAIREQLLAAAHIHAEDPAATTEGPPPPKAEEEIVRLNHHDLLLGALTENHIAQMIVLLITVGGSGMGVIIGLAERSPGAFGSTIVFLAILGCVVASWLWGAGSYYLKYGDFTVRKSNDIYRISYGLLNKVQTAIRPGRIEYLLMSTSLPQRYLRRANLRVGTASTFAEAGVLAPVALFVQRDVAVHGAARTFQGLDIDACDWRPFSPIFYLARTSRTIIWLGIAATVAQFSSATWAWWAFAVYAALLLIRLITLFLAAPENGFAINEKVIAVRQGYYEQKITAMPIERIENVAITQPWWWKTRQASGVRVQAMKHVLVVGAMPDASVDALLSYWHGVAREYQVELETATS